MSGFSDVLEGLLDERAPALALGHERAPLHPLGDRAEAAFRQTMMGSKGALGIFWSNSLVGTITTLALLMLFWPLISVGWNKLRAR